MAQVVGNASMVSSKEEQVAQMLRDKYLQHKNETAAKVYPKDTFYTRHGKRVLDILISLPVFVITLPINLILAVCTFFDVGRPVLFKQTRVGKDGKTFTLVKFRNMNNKKGPDGKLLPASQRVTKFGRIVRKLSLDELLNFWSVLKGDMSIIGPRPQPLFIYDRMCDRHRMRTAVRPGLECPRVIHVPGEEISNYQRTYENDTWYVENVSLKTDLKMVLLLIKMVFSFEKRGNQAIGKGVTYFVGYDENGLALSMLNYTELYEEKNKDE